MGLSWNTSIFTTLEHKQLHYFVFLHVSKREMGVLVFDALGRERETSGVEELVDSSGS